MKVAGVGVITGWGRGVDALPADAAAAADGRYVVAIPPPAPPGDRLRRATRECLLGIGAVEELLQTVARPASELAGPGTALLYVTASAYGAANRSFLEAGGGTLHFPYTAPSAVPAEVAIEYGLCGAYVNFIGGAAATVDALWYAESLLERGACTQALVLAVETFAECADLYRRARWLAAGPLVEAAACALLDLRVRAPDRARRRRRRPGGDRRSPARASGGAPTAIMAQTSVRGGGSGAPHGK
ncbi:MAG: hypothetical protein DME06_18735 [Candidatus Rokuibacteriota bacterium]|nr:MAG: hypothetical protein DME06_18735 [Candidatus Rokubacteria bacterium]